MRRRPIVFVWENFGPMHIDRCKAVADQYSGQRRVIGIELAGTSDVYEWRRSDAEKFVKITLFPGRKLSETSILSRIFRLMRTCFLIGRADYFFCHYERYEVFICSLLLRLFFQKVFVMGDSKYDDKPRGLAREILKIIFYLPYSGALAAGTRSTKYFRFLGIGADHIKLGYDTISLGRIQSSAISSEKANSTEFKDRHFTVVARFVPKKNIRRILLAYAMYIRKSSAPRLLQLCGSGELEPELRRVVSENGLQDYVKFCGFVQSEVIAETLARTLALLLVSVEEQFGLVVIEAQALGIPVIYSPNCGARDELLRSGVNGFLVEPDNCEGIARFMHLIDESEELWRRLSLGARSSSLLGDVARFTQSVAQMTEGGKAKNGNN